MTTYYPAPTGNYDLVTANNVGIGTTSPSSKLEVQAGQIRALDVPWDGVFQTPRMAAWIRNQAPGFLVDVDSDYAFFGLKHEGPANSNRNDVVIGWGDDGRENGAVQAGDSVRFVHFTAGAEYERLRIDPAGNVGIGTAMPTQKLVVAGPVRIVQGIQNSFGGHLYLAKQDAAPGTGLWHFNITPTGIAGVAGNALNFVESGIADYRMVIAPGGNVGIGLADPRGLLHTYASTTRNFLLVDSDRDGDNPSTFQLWGLFSDGQKGKLQMVARGNHPSAAYRDAFDFSIFDGTAWKERMLRFNRNGTAAFLEGNVGIGVDDPQAKLDIAGTAGTDGIRFPDGVVQTTGLPNCADKEFLQYSAALRKWQCTTSQPPSGTYHITGTTDGDFNLPGADINYLCQTVWPGSHLAASNEIADCIGNEVCNISDKYWVADTAPVGAAYSCVFYRSPQASYTGNILQNFIYSAQPCNQLARVVCVE